RAVGAQAHTTSIDLLAAGSYVPMYASALLPARRRLHRSDVDLPHLEHRGHGALGACLVGVGEQLHEPRRDDLPREAEAVLDPAPRPLLPTAGEPPRGQCHL